MVWVGLGLCGFAWFGLIWVVGWFGYVWRRGGMETMAFWSALIFLCVGWSVLVDLMLNLIFRVSWSICMGWYDFSLVSDDFFVWVDWYVWVDRIFLWFLMIFHVGWSVCVGWSDFCLVFDDGGDGGWVVMVVVGLWERGAVREWIIKISKIMNILINKCVE